MRKLYFKTFLSALILLVAISPTTAQNTLLNGDFSDPLGTPWEFNAQAASSVAYSTGSAIITGSNNSSGISSGSTLRQCVSIAASQGNPQSMRLQFDWHYFSVDDPGYDSASYDIINMQSGASLLGGQALIADSASSGQVQITLDLAGQICIVFKVSTEDNLQGPAILSLDNVIFESLNSNKDFIRGDVNLDQSLTIADPIVLLSILFPNASSPGALCFDAADCNDNGNLELPDAVLLINATFAVSPVLLPPPAACAADPSADSLGCLTSNCP